MSTRRIKSIRSIGHLREQHTPYRSRQHADLSDRVAVLVDDGLSDPVTVRVAIAAVKSAGAAWTEALADLLAAVSPLGSPARAAALWSP